MVHLQWLQMNERDMQWLWKQESWRLMCGECSGSGWGKERQGEKKEIRKKKLKITVILMSDCSHLLLCHLLHEPPQPILVPPHSDVFFCCNPHWYPWDPAVRQGTIQEKRSIFTLWHCNNKCKEPARFQSGFPIYDRRPCSGSQMNSVTF